MYDIQSSLAAFISMCKCKFFLQILNASHPVTGRLLLTKLIEFLDRGTDNVNVSAVADVLEFLCIADNSYLAIVSCSRRILIEMSEELLWWNAVERLLNFLSDQSALSPVTVSRLIVCMMNILTIVAGNSDILLIDHACLDESHYLSVFEQQTADVCAELEDSSCKVASKLIEYGLVDMPLICVCREKSTSFPPQIVRKIINTLRLIYCQTDPKKLSDILARRKCSEIVGITWIHPVIMWSLRQSIFMHSYYELSSTVFDECINDMMVSLCGELKPVADDITQSVAELTELQKNPQHHFERALFVISHQLDGYEGHQNSPVYSGVVMGGL